MTNESDFSASSVFAAGSDWNKEREALQSEVMRAAEALLTHSRAAAITLPGLGFTVSMALTETSGVPQ